MILLSQICVIEMTNHLKIDQDMVQYSAFPIQDGKARDFHCWFHTDQVLHV